MLSARILCAFAILALAVLCCATAATAQYSETFDVTQYGAVGDGQTDNTLPVWKATQAALASAAQNVIISFPAGTFLFSSPPAQNDYFYLNLTSIAGGSIPGGGAVVVAGAGTGATTLVVNTTLGGFLQCAGDRPVPAQCQLRAFTLQLVCAPLPTTSANLPILFLYTQGSMLSDLVVVGPAYSEALVSIYESEQLIIRDVDVQQVTGAAFSIQNNINSIALVDTNITAAAGYSQSVGVILNYNFTEVSLLRVAMTGLAYGVSTQLSGETVSDFSVQRSVFTDCGVQGIQIYSDVSATVTDSVFENTVPVSQSGLATTGIIVSTLPSTTQPTGAQVTLTGVSFSNLATGVQQTTGQVSVTQSWFYGNTVGYAFQYSSVTSEVTPFQLKTNTFSAQVTNNVVASGGSGFVVESNTCIGSAPFALTCSGSCVVQNNVGCSGGAAEVADE